MPMVPMYQGGVPSVVDSGQRAAGGPTSESDD